MSARVVLITVPDRETGLRIARALVEERLAACVNLVPGLTSVYRWEGKIQEDPELLLIVKTGAERLAALTGRVKELHPYTVPEVVALEIAAGLPAYLDWVREETS